MKKLRTAIIGYGRSGRDIHTNLQKQLPELYEIVAIVDEDSQRREMIASETGARALSRYEEIYELSDIDLVVNATFSDNHQPITLDLLNHGLNVLTEKPAATTRAKFQQLLDAAEKNRVMVQAFQQYRFGAAFNKMRDVMKSGALGRIVHISMFYGGFSRRWDWQTVHGRAAGSLLNTGPHPVDHTLALMDFPEDVNVFCYMDRALTSGDGEDYVKLLLTAKDAPLGEIEISASNAYPRNTYFVEGTKGTLTGTPNHLDWKTFEPENEPPRPVDMRPLRDADGKPVYCREKLTITEHSWDASPEQANDFNYKGLAFYRALYGKMVNGDDLEVKNENIMLQIKVMEEAHRQNAGLFH